MKHIRERLKNPRAKRGCLACYSMGSAKPAYAYVEVEYIPLSLMPGQQAVVKEIGICWEHAQRKAGYLDPEAGQWKKTPFGWMPEREELYQLIGGRGNTALLVGACKRGIPTWW